jgi:hypothetical protein
MLAQASACQASGRTVLGRREDVGRAENGLLKVQDCTFRVDVEGRRPLRVAEADGSHECKSEESEEDEIGKRP